MYLLFVIAMIIVGYIVILVVNALIMGIFDNDKTSGKVGGCATGIIIILVAIAIIAQGISTWSQYGHF